MNLGEMGSINCMNEVCCATVSSEWKKGWTLKSGAFATLCYNCGSAYENSVFCETFHSNESGWRECRTCRKRIHCGCIASRYLHEYMDLGGVGCITCVKRMEIHPLQTMQIASDSPSNTFVTNGVRDIRPNFIENTKRLLQLTGVIEANDLHSPLDQPKREDFMLQTGESSKHFTNLTQPFTPSPFINDKGRPTQGTNAIYDSPTTFLNNSSSHVLPFKIGVAEGGEQNKSSSQQGHKMRIILPKGPKPSPVAGGSESYKASGSQPRVARAPPEGRGRNQLLPRYWPRVTDQELQKLSGDLKSNIVPLFEKILSSSDAGRIGRLVVPKACAEAYFPPINQSEGIPIKIRDIKGKEWTFQFRFWPNNNSRMYVLEGVTPCIQHMQLEAGDTVTFSKSEPGGQLVIGCRKATNNADMQDGDSNGEISFSGAIDNQLSMATPGKKAKNIKNKRLLMDRDDATELRVTWEETQELLRPSLVSKKSVFMVEDHEFEEFEEPPVFGKRTIFTSRPSGEQEQLAQCDTCLKWRRLPVDALLPAKWSCSENKWDSNRATCSAPEDINPRDLEFYFGIKKEYKSSREGQPSGLDALATAAVLGDNIPEMVESSLGATTRHPRHRPGCSCIVCIQPPSGTGKHEPSCKCNVCLTVKRRFKTLMMRKKKKQRDAELAQEEKDRLKTQAGSSYGVQVGLEGEDIDALASMNANNSNMENEMIYNGEEMDLGEDVKEEGLDLNSDPLREDEILAEAARMSLTNLMNAATFPTDLLMEESEIVPSLRPCLVSQNVDDGEKIGGVDAAGFVRRKR